MSSESDSPLGLFFDQSNKVLLVTFSGTFTRNTTIALNKAAKAVVERYGHVAVIPDFSDVTEFALQLRDWPELGNSRRAIRGKLRMLVAPQTPISHLFGCTEPTMQALAMTRKWFQRGWRPTAD